MSTTGISEFTFGFGFLHEQIVRLRQQELADGIRLTGAPVFPSPQFEAGRGYDVYLPTTGADYYFQFKASDYFSDMRSERLANGFYKDPYYRIKLHKDGFNQQHRALRILSRDKEHTYYVAPEIDSLAHYNTAFLGGTITENSRKIPLRGCDDILDENQHYITFQSGNAGWDQHSFSNHHDHSILGKQIIPEYIKYKSEWKKIDDQYTSNLFSEISEAAIKIVSKNELGMILEKFSISLELFKQSVVNEKFILPRRIETLIKTSFILSHVFGATLFIVGSQDNSNSQNQ